MKSSRFVSGILVIYLACACADSALLDERYASAIQQAKKVGDSEQGTHFQHCLAGMDKSQRRAVRNEMSSKGVFSSPAYIAIEAGNSGWGGYHSSFLWVDELGKGRMVTDMGTKTWGNRVERTFPANDLVTLLKVVPTGRPIAGTVNPDVADGTCYFVTIKNQDNAVQFAAYAPGKRAAIEESEAIIDQVRKFVDRYSTP
jgi:hypothetical protein